MEACGGSKAGERELGAHEEQNGVREKGNV
jgi:hypothetical protein